MPSTHLHPLSLQANASGWHSYSKRRGDPNFSRFFDAVLQRDQHTCRFCGFQADEYQDVINLDGNYNHNTTDNMVTACCFCAQCFFLESVGKQDYGGGLLVYLPEMTQSELSGLCHVLFCAIENATEYRTDAQNILNDLRLRARPVDERFGDGMSNPAMLGQMLVDTPMENREEVIAATLADLRLLPLRKKFRQQIKSWATAAMGAIIE